MKAYKGFRKYQLWFDNGSFIKDFHTITKLKKYLKKEKFDTNDLVVLQVKPVKL